MEKIIDDTELGRLIIKEHPNARRFTFRTKADAIYVTVPPKSTLKELQSAIKELREKLLASRKRISRKPIDWNFEINAELFRLTIVPGTINKFISSSPADGQVSIICPQDTDFNNDQLQRWLEKVIEEALRKKARDFLPARLSGLSAACNLSFGGVKINTSKGRWGSCSAKKNINLSCYLMLLPVHLIDYVLLHELAHTIEMNHSEKFWKLLNSLTDNKAHELRSELRKYATSF